MNNSVVVKGSVSDVAASSGKSLAESFLNVDNIVIIDVSGSMDTSDVRRNGRNMSRYDVACDELARLQASIPGGIAIIAFSDMPVFVPGGQPPFIGGGTNLTQALGFVSIADGVVDRIIVISDGQPDNEHTAINVAKGFTTPISTIYVGPEGGYGAAFLAKLAALHGGFSVVQAVDKLEESVTRMLKAGK